MDPIWALSALLSGVAAAVQPAAPYVSDALLSQRSTMAVPVPMRPPTPAYRRVAFRLRARPEMTQRYDRLISEHARRNGLDARLVKSIIAAESEFHPGARSPAGARGLMQLMPRTAEGLGVARRDLHDPEANIRGGTDYLSYLFRAAWKRYGLREASYREAPLWVRQKVIAAYHGGPRFLAGGPWPGATRAYVRQVLSFYQSPLSALAAPEAALAKAG